jgi:hypothetical protein
MVFTRCFANYTNDVELWRGGAIGRILDSVLGMNSLEVEFEGIWYDILSFGWHCAADLLLTGVVLCVFQLLLGNELGTDHSILMFLNRMGSTARGLGWHCTCFGIIIPFALPKTIRRFWSLQTYGGLALQCLWSPLFGGCAIYCVWRIIVAFYMAAEEQSRYEPISIPEDEIKTLAEEYFKLKPKTYSLKGFLGSLGESSSLGYKVPLSYETTILAKLHFQRIASVKLGLRRQSRNASEITTVI